MEFLYPGPSGRIFIPVELDGRKGQGGVRGGASRMRRPSLFWHLDETYVGRTELLHQLAVDIAPGLHTVSVVDGDGIRISRRFEVLAAD